MKYNQRCNKDHVIFDREFDETCVGRNQSVTKCHLLHCFNGEERCENLKEVKKMKQNKSNGKGIIDQNSEVERWIIQVNNELK